MGGPEDATLPLVLRIAGGKFFADGQGSAILFKRADEIAALPHSPSDLIAGVG